MGGGSTLASLTRRAEDGPTRVLKTRNLPHLPSIPAKRVKHREVQPSQVMKPQQSTRLPAESGEDSGVVHVKDHMGVEQFLTTSPGF